ncbi:MAG: IS3 family transposase, partial [Senegalia sp. (in: firmicutes)]
FFRSLKSEKLYHDEIYYFNQAYESIKFYINEYNFYRGHNRFQNSTPSEVFF